MTDLDGFRRRVRDGVTLGTWAVVPDPIVGEIIARAGMDFAIIDLEHGPWSYSEAQAAVAAIQGGGGHALIRVPRNDESEILRALETGADGIVVPHITSADAARRAVRASRYAPEGERGASPFTRSSNYALGPPPEAFARANRRVAVIVLVEGTDGVANIAEIAAVDGIDVVYVGTYDLSQAAGHPGQAAHPEVQALTRGCVEQIRAAGRVPGMLVEGADDIRRARSIGINFRAFRADCALLATAVANAVALAKEIENE